MKIVLEWDYFMTSTLFTVTCESLVSREFSRILLTFHFSRQIHFTFHSRSRSKRIFISLFILDLDLNAFSFHFSFSKWVKLIFISLFTSRNKWTRFPFHFSLLELPISTLAGHWLFMTSTCALLCTVQCVRTSGGTLLWENRRLIGRSLIVLARKVQNNRD